MPRRIPEDSDQAYNPFSPPMAEGLNLAKRACYAARHAQHLAPRVVSIFYNHRFVPVNAPEGDALLILPRKTQGWSRGSPRPGGLCPLRDGRINYSWYRMYTFLCPNVRGGGRTLGPYLEIAVYLA